uniref:Uncharacterized protein n=1 Tax=Anguilla anguilla TaxID=7936 RepID=A0A0E9SIN9_ANGAN
MYSFPRPVLHLLEITKSVSYFLTLRQLRLMPKYCTLHNPIHTLFC